MTIGAYSFTHFSRDHTDFCLCASKCGFNCDHVVGIGLVLEQQPNVLGAKEVAVDPAVDDTDRHVGLQVGLIVEASGE